MPIIITIFNKGTKNWKNCMVLNNTFCRTILKTEVKEIFAVVRKPGKNSEALTGFEPMASAIPDRLSYEASPEAGQVQVQFIPVI